MTELEQIAQRLEAIRRSLDGDQWTEVRLWLQDAVETLKEVMRAACGTGQARGGGSVLRAVMACGEQGVNDQADRCGGQ